MGALIMTKGTKRLVAHYNDEFDTWIDFYRQPAQLNLFRRSGDMQIWEDLVLTITDRTAGHSDRTDFLTLLPKDHPKHQRLSARWRIFLKTHLSQLNRNKLADLLYQALTGPNRYIVFDVRVGANQDVTLLADTDDGDPIARLTIVTTGALPAQPLKASDDLPPIDD
jgi:hypothetical protein